MTSLNYNKVNDDTPILVGCSQHIDKNGTEGLNYLEILEVASKKAIKDCESKFSIEENLDAISVIRFVADTPNRDTTTTNMWGYPNMPRSLSHRLGANISQEIYTATGGNSPQLAINEIALRIKKGNIKCALIAGGEALDTFVSRLKSGKKMNWSDDPGGSPEIIGSTREGSSEHEKLHGLYDPSVVYPLFANGLRRKDRTTIAEHMKEIGTLFSRFSRVASDNDYAWFPLHRSAKDIAEIKPENRIVGFPYTKYMNSIMRVNQSSALIMTSAKKARELKIPESKWIFLNGGACLNEIWNVTERVDYHSSPAIKKCIESVLNIANINSDELDFFDIYSCFPCAVQIAIREIGLKPNDPRGLTLTGGLPYFGGPGNTYVLNAISSLMEKLRKNPGKKGLVTANGWYLTKHGAGIFSSKPFEGEWNQIVDNGPMQKEIDQLEHPEFTELAEGDGKIETYTISHSRKGAEKAIIIGRLKNDKRFLANSYDAKILQIMMEEEMLDAKVTVSFDGKRNIFKLN